MADESAPAGISIRNLDNTTRKVMVELDTDNSGKVSASEIKTFVQGKNAQVRRLLLIGAAAFLLLVGSIAVIGGVTYYTVQVSKETKALGADLVSATTGEKVHVLSTEASWAADEVHAGFADDFFSALSTVTVSQGTASVKLHVVGFLRDAASNVRVLTPSATVPCLFFNASGGSVSGCDPATTAYLVDAGVLVDPALHGRRLGGGTGCVGTKNNAGCYRCANGYYRSATNCANCIRCPMGS